MHIQQRLVIICSLALGPMALAGGSFDSISSATQSGRAPTVDASSKTPARVNPLANWPKPTSQMTLDNLVLFVRYRAMDSTDVEIRTSRAPLENRIILSLTENPQLFLNELAQMPVRKLLLAADGISILQRIDGLLTVASQELAAKTSEALRSNGSRSQSLAQASIAKIQVIEKKRDELAAWVASVQTEANFNAVFDYMIQAHFRRAEGINQTLVFPNNVKRLLYGRYNPNQTAFQTLKRMTLSVLTSTAEGPLLNLRKLKINSTAQLVPFFKPNLRSWEVEAHFRRTGNRLPSSVSSR